MKMVFYPWKQKIDMAPLIAAFPQIKMVTAETPEEVAREIADAEIMAANSGGYGVEMVKAVNDNARKLKWIHFMTSGIESAIRAGGFPEHVVVTNSAGLRAPNLSEHAFAMLLFLNRKLRTIEAARPTRGWVRYDVWDDIIGLSGQTLVIVGLGSIGQAVARKAKAFNMKVIGISRGYKPDANVDEVYPRERAKEALARAQAVLVSIPSEPATMNFLDADKLSVLKSAYVINVARGDVIDEAALIRGLKSGAIKGAGLDVMSVEPLPADHELWTLDNVIITPHVGGAGSPDNRELIDMVAENLRLYLAGKPVPRVVDWKKMVE